MSNRSKDWAWKKELQRLRAAGVLSDLEAQFVDTLEDKTYSVMLSWAERLAAEIVLERHAADFPVMHIIPLAVPQLAQLNAAWEDFTNEPWHNQTWRDNGRIT